MAEPTAWFGAFALPRPPPAALARHWAAVTAPPVLAAVTAKPPLAYTLAQRSTD
jgi:hypothetical protein